MNFITFNQFLKEGEGDSLLQNKVGHQPLQLPTENIDEFIEKINNVYDSLEIAISSGKSINYKSTELEKIKEKLEAYIKTIKKEKDKPNINY